MPQVTLEEFLSCCRELEAKRDHVAGLNACDQLLAQEPTGRILTAALRYRAVFTLQASQANVGKAIGNLVVALDSAADCPQDQPAILVTTIAAYGMHGSPEPAQRFADQYFELAALNRAPEIQQYMPKVWFNLGYAYDAALEYSQAVNAYCKSREAAIDMPGSFNQGLPEHNLVAMYLELGRVEDALAMLDESRNHLDHAVYGCLIRNNAAKCELALRRFQEAERYCEEALEHPSRDERGRAEVYFTMAQMQKVMGKLAEAGSWAQQALDIARSLPHPRLSHKVGGFLMALQQREEVPE